MKKLINYLLMGTLLFGSINCKNLMSNYNFKGIAHGNYISCFQNPVSKTGFCYEYYYNLRKGYIDNFADGTVESIEIFWMKERKIDKRTATKIDQIDYERILSEIKVQREKKEIEKLKRKLNKR